MEMMESLPRASLGLVLPTHSLVMECKGQGDGEENAPDDWVACSPAVQIEAKLLIVQMQLP